jgi:hypothetical protein
VAVPVLGKALRAIAVVAGAWAFLVVLSLLHLLPWVPRSRGEWLFLLVAGPPAYLAMEAVGTYAFGGKRCVARDVVAALVILAVIGSILWFGWRAAAR